MKNRYLKLNRICENPYFPLLMVPMASCFLLLYSFTTSPLYLNDGMDSAVFKTMGLALLKGRIPYADIFDHKGPILYFINALGQWIIPGRTGILFLQVVGLSIALVFLFNIARLFIDGFSSFVVVLLTLFIFSGIIQEGNQCEEWMMYFFSIPFYLIMRYAVHAKDRPHPLKHSIVYGFCFGATLMIRPNDAVAMMGGLMTGLLLWLIYRKEYRNALLNALCFVGGTLVIVIPVIGYFIHHHAICDFFYGLVLFNIAYSGGVLKMLTMLIVKTALILVFVNLSLLIFYHSNSRHLLVFVLPALFLEWLLFGSNSFPHYYIVLLPFYLLFLVFLVMQWSKKTRNKPFIILSFGILFFSTHIGDRSSVVVSANSFKEKIALFTQEERNNAKKFYNETETLLSVIPQEETDSVWNYNLRWESGYPNICSPFSCLWHSGIVQCNKVTYALNEKLIEDDNLCKKKPLWVVRDRKAEANNGIAVDNYLKKTYMLVATTDTTICFLELYHRK